jgi:glycosyltransferase involved in cell wall biosynthesis
MRVLYVTNMWPDDQRPWYGSFIHSQARSLEALGIELDVLAIRGYATNREYLRGAAQALVRNLRDGYDAVHAHYGHSAVVARMNVRAPLVVSYCGDDLLGTPDPTRSYRMTRRSCWLAIAFAQLAWVANATITKSEEMERRLPDRLRTRNHVIPNGVDLDRFVPMDQQAARRCLGWSLDEKVALFVGDPAVPRKNHALAKAACAQATKSCPELRLRVAWGIPPEDVPVWMSAADALILPSWSEGSPNAVKEAMACELPIVATPVGDIPERLRGIPGCHVLPPDEQRFADALLEALHHGRCPAAREAVSELSLMRVARRVAQVYESVSLVGR